MRAFAHILYSCSMKLAETVIKPRKLPRQQRAVAVVEAIYEAAARILEEGGLSTFNTNALAERAGVSVGSLYQYFPSKEAILAGLVRQSRARLLADITTAVGERHQDFESAVEPVILAAIQSQFERADLARTLEYFEAILPLDSETALLKGRIAALIADFLERWRIVAGPTAARDLTAIARGMIDAAGLEGEPDVEGLKRRVKAACLGYLDRMR